MSVNIFKKVKPIAKIFREKFLWSRKVFRPSFNKKSDGYALLPLKENTLEASDAVTG